MPLFEPGTSFAENIRHALPKDDTELRQSMQLFGWKKEFPALMDENGVVLVGHRRLEIARSLGIQPYIKKLVIGQGDAADAERLALSLTSNVGFALLTRKDRQHISRHLAQQGWTAQRTAKALNVGAATVYRDLEGFLEMRKPDRPKGGRPRGPAPLPPEREKAAELFLDQGLTRDEVKQETGVSSMQTQLAIERLRGRREAPPAIERKDLSMTAQEKFDAALRRAKKEMEVELTRRVREELADAFDKLLPSYLEKERRYEAVLKARKGIYTRAEYTKIRACLHPDRVTDPAMKKRFEDAFTLFTRMEVALLSEADHPTPASDLPRNYADWMARKAQMQAVRKAQRGTRQPARS